MKSTRTSRLWSGVSKRLVLYVCRRQKENVWWNQAPEVVNKVKYSEMPTMCEESVSWCSSSRCWCYSVVLLVNKARFRWFEGCVYIRDRFYSNVHWSKWMMLFKKLGTSHTFPSELFRKVSVKMYWSFHGCEGAENALCSALGCLTARHAFWSGRDVNTAGLTRLSGWTWQQSVPYEHRDGRLGDQMSKQ